MGLLKDVTVPFDYGSPKVYYAGHEIAVDPSTAKLLQDATKAAVDEGATTLVSAGHLTLLVGPTVPIAIYLPPEPETAVTAQLDNLH
ncbi:hypothetical protein [Mycobacteroides abscessus]|uniref:hypothetical protein n=1 Tax=Mycobacteroides abscessus TaxID=36809 RepID=UPI0007F97F01|nr:hypothetical protein [Mycobacteroides abscessus]ANN98187.1 hypothetical protein BAB74_05095 [Mycobacteroides abscessus]